MTATAFRASSEVRGRDAGPLRRGPAPVPGISTPGGWTVVQEKPLGEFAELGTNYEGSYKPARMGLHRALESGRMRNPLTMPQSTAPWTARRPNSAGSTSSRPSSRAKSAGRTRTGTALTVEFRETQMGLGAHQDKGPGITKPQRIELPSYLNTPQRSPDPLSPDERTQAIRRIQDLELLTFACRRANKVREEGRAHFSLGILRDNLGQHAKAITSYNEFLRVCKESGDGQGMALAYHCIAVDHQLIATEIAAAAGYTIDKTDGAAPGSGVGEANAGDDGKAKPQGMKMDSLQKAIFFHNKHRENADTVGKYVAHLNMGLAYAQSGEREASTVNYQYALRYALQLHSLEGQSLAIGSLGFGSSMYDNDPEKMRVLIERYVELCSTLKQPRNQAVALKKLGIIASQQGDNEMSISYFQQAINHFRAQGDRDAEKDCSVRLGIAAGQAKMADHMSGILQRSLVQGYGQNLVG